MHWWLITKLRTLEFRRRLVDWVREVPAVAFLMGFALLGMLFLMASVYRVVSNSPILMATQQLPVLLLMSLITGVLGTLGLAPRDLMPKGLLPALPLTDGVIVLGAAVPIMLLTGLMATVLVGPGFVALARVGVMTGFLAWLSAGAVVILQVSTAWLTLVTGLMAGRWRILVALLLSSVVWMLLGSPLLNPFAPTPWLAVCVLLLLGLDVVATAWVVHRFHWSSGAAEVGTAPPLGHQLAFPKGRLAWLGLEVRLALRDRKGWLFNATVTGSLWLLIGLLTWFPTLFGQGAELQSQRLAEAT